MKRLITIFAIVLGSAPASWAAAPGPLTSLRAIHALTNAEAGQAIPVAFEATVTYVHRTRYILFVQDDGVGIYVAPPADTPAELAAGDRILVRGRTAPSFRPIVVGENITLLRHGELPRPLPATFDELNHNLLDAMLVTVRGVVRSADKAARDQEDDAACLYVLTEGGYMRVSADRFTPEIRRDLLDAEVEITGVEGGEFDGKMQMHGVHLHVTSPADVKILKRAAAGPWSLPITPLDEVIGGYHITDRTQRVRVHGTITYYQPGSSVVLQGGARSLWISTLTLDPLQVGDVVDATGFPEAHNGFLALTHGEILDNRVHSPLGPLLTTGKELVRGRHAIDLVSIEGQVLSAATGATQDEYGLIADGQLFSAIYRHPQGYRALAPMRQIPLGSRVRVTGICIMEDSNPFAEQVPFDILMRSFDDITVIAPPSLLNVRNLVLVVGLLVALVLVAGGRGWILERKVRQKTSALAARIEAEAAIERRRSRILEDINGSRPLGEILQQITDLVSFKLDGAPCWCQIAGTAPANEEHPKPQSPRIVREEITAHSGVPLGRIFAYLDPTTQPCANESEALAMGAGLITLAIDTRQLYTDLLHRSEFDLLTDIHNRFSLDTSLDSLIEDCRLKAREFGLIYIDLDEFKQVNDVWGHQVGDLYLQEAALRMKGQLRSIDLLARIGGDEFSVLVPDIRCRADVEEIALRLLRSFDDPFRVDGRALHGAASVGIAVYPEDALTKDGLLNAADTDMYKAKNAKKHIVHLLEGDDHRTLAPKGAA